MSDRPTYRPVYKAIHRPLTVCGVDRRLFFLALILGAATFNLFSSFLAGLLMFVGLYGFSLWATEFVNVIEAWRKWVRGDSEEELRLELSGDSAGESADMAGGCLRGYWLW